MVVYYKDHAAAATAVTAVGTAGCDILFAVEVYAAIAALAGFDFDFYYINKHKSFSFMTAQAGIGWSLLIN